MPFGDAWGPVTASVVSALVGDERVEWFAALNATRGAWQAAYERQPSTRQERALVAVASDPERAPIPDRECRRCEADVSHLRRLAKYCGADCRRAAHLERTLAAAA